MSLIWQNSILKTPKTFWLIFYGLMCHKFFWSTWLLLHLVSYRLTNSQYSGGKLSTELVITDETMSSFSYVPENPDGACPSILKPKTSIVKLDCAASH